MRAHPIFLVPAVLAALLWQGCIYPVLSNLTNRTQDYAGTWEYRNGTAHQACDGELSSDSPLADVSTQVVFRAGATADLTLLLGECRWPLDVVGSDAYIHTDEACHTVDVQSGDSIVTSAQQGQFSLDSNGRIISQDDTIFETRRTSVGGALVRRCRQTVHGTLRRVSRSTELPLASASSSSSSASSSGGSQLCNNTCRYAHDGACDDGGTGSQTSLCTLGSDCADCGPR